MSESVPFAPRPRAARRHAPSFDVDNWLFAFEGVGVLGGVGRVVVV